MKQVSAYVKNNVAIILEFIFGSGIQHQKNKGTV